MIKTRILVAAALGSSALICLIIVTTAWAGMTDTQKNELKKCTYTYNQCVKACPDQLSQSHNQIGACQQACLNQYYECRQKARIPGYVRGPGGSTEPTVAPNKSNPTPTPQKGPSKIGPSGIGHSSPTHTVSKDGR
jgi:hypothetical protein